MRESHKRILKLTLTALLAALTFWGSKAEIILPVTVGGYSRFHLGNILCALSGMLLGPGWGGLAAGLGSALYDCTSPAYIMEAPITFCTKGLYGVVAGLMFYRLFKRKDSYPAMLASTTVAALGYIVIYLVKTFFYNSLLVGGLTTSAAWIAVVEKVPSSLFNGGVAVVVAPVLGLAIVKALRRSRLDEVLA